MAQKKTADKIKTTKGIKPYRNKSTERALVCNLSGLSEVFRAHARAGLCL